MACMGRTSRSRRPCARGEVLCTEPGKSHPCPDRQAGPVHEGNSRTMNMHADENSDGVIVPEKRSNNEGVSSAETVKGSWFEAVLPEKNPASHWMANVTRAYGIIRQWGGD